MLGRSSGWVGGAALPQLAVAAGAGRLQTNRVLESENVLELRIHIQYSADHRRAVNIKIEIFLSNVGDMFYNG